jgi:xanthine permease XanP
VERPPGAARDAFMKPSTLAYGVDDRPPPVVALLSAAQHVAMVTGIGVVFPLLVLHEAGAGADATDHVIRLSMVALGIATLLQSLRSHYVGSGYLAPAVFTAAYLPANLAAAQLGGLPMVAGMTMLAGLTEIVLAWGVVRLRPFLPSEIAGFAVMMIGIVLGVLGFDLIAVKGEIHAHAHNAVLTHAIVLGGASLAIMVGLNVWGGTRLRLYSVLVGILAGYVAAAQWGELDTRPILAALRELPSLPALPLALPHFSADLAVPYAIGAVASVLRVLGDITTCQKINDRDWTRPDMKTIRGGLIANGLGTLIAGALGTVGVNTFSGSIALSAATGVTSRFVGFVAGGILILLAALPSATETLSNMPRPVMGAILVYSGCFILVNGLQIIMTRSLDNRKILVIGLSLIAGLCSYAFPSFFAALPPHVAPLAASPFELSVLTALILNALFRIGVQQRATMLYDPASTAFGALADFVVKQGGRWGARRDVVERVNRALREFAQMAGTLVASGHAASVRLSFDDIRIEVRLNYRGEVYQRAAAPPTQEAAGLEFLVTPLADQVKMRHDGDRQTIKLSFHH